ncbi:hypothetical protein HanIR_Chr01g0014991 [Helianthus annuus]|nr:hypothetical protein HanIR_Chr01g0014991 [Helianthus annuus]
MDMVVTLIARQDALERHTLLLMHSAYAQTVCKCTCYIIILVEKKAIGKHKNHKTKRILTTAPLDHM